MSDAQRPVTARMLSAATVLPLLGAFLLLSPIVAVFASPVSVLGVPLIVAYVFGVWLLLIVASLLLSRRLRALQSPAAVRESPPADSA